MDTSAAGYRELVAERNFLFAVKFSNYMRWLHFQWGR
jgi:hypothetical protein